MNYKNILILVSFLLILSGCASQQKQVKKADSFFENGEYVKALDLYEKIIVEEKSKFYQSVFQYQIAECYRMLNNYRKAEGAYRKAIKLKTNEKEAHYWYGYMLLKNEKYKEAKESFETFKKIKPKDKRAKAGIKSCDNAEKWVTTPTRYEVTNLRSINSRENDFAAAYTSNDYNSIYFTSSRQEEEQKQEINPVSGMFYTSIYEARIDRNKGVWLPASKIQDTILNTEFDNGAVSISPDGANIYYTICKQETGKQIGCQIYNSALRVGSWSNPQRVEILPDSISIGHPSISADGLELYFASAMDGGEGGLDIWKSQRISESAPWGKPINIGPEVNTAGNEAFPFIREDGVLYFSSDAHAGMGGLDIFRASKDANGKWSIINMKYPINSSQDDFGIVFQGKKEKGLFTSNRKGGKGDEDIYSFELPELEITVKGIVSDIQNKKTIENAEVLLIGSDGTMQTVQTKLDGSFAFKLNQYVDYLVVASYNGYLRKKIQISTANVFDNTTFENNISLITMSKPVEVPHIFYDAGKWTFNDASKPAIEELGKLLEDNPNIVIEISSHTDMVGDSVANIILSKKRAQSVIDYLQQNGYDADRLVAKGFGASKPVTITEAIAVDYPMFTVGTVLDANYILLQPKDIQDKANQINRRTELKILSADYIPKPEFFERKKKKK